MQKLVNQKQKISNEERKEIVKSNKNGESMYSIAKRYNVVHSTIKNILVKEEIISQDKSIFTKMWKESLPIIEKMDIEMNTYRSLRSKMKIFVEKGEIESWEDFVSIEIISNFFSQMKIEYNNINYVRTFLKVLGNFLNKLLSEENFFKFNIEISENPFHSILEDSLKKDITIFDKMWTDSLPFIKDMGIAKSSISSLRSKMKIFVEKGNIQSWGDFMNPKRILGFIEIMQESNKSNGYIRNILKVLSSLTEQIKGMVGFEQVPIEIKKNYFAYVLKKRKSTLKHKVKSYPPRDKDEIEIWISLINNIEHRFFWALGSNGLRTEEIIRLKKNQFDLDSRFIYKVWRKGSGEGINTSYHEVLAIPKYLIPISRMYLSLLKDNEKLFKKERKYYTTNFSEKYMSNLKLIREELERKVVLQPEMKELLDSLRKLEKNGAILNHSFRSTWDTHAGSVGMVEDIQAYHLNHNLEGMKNVYVQIENDNEAKKRYLREIDEKAISYDLGD